MAKRIVMTIEGEDVSAEVELLEEETPETCAVIWEALPISGTGVQAKMMGDIIFVGIPNNIRTEKEENCASTLLPGEVYYFFTAPGKYFGWGSEPSVEIGWAYDRYNRITTPFEPVLGNVFGRMVGDATKFLEACRKMQREGTKEVTIRRAE